MSGCCGNHHNHEEKDACTVVNHYYCCCCHDGNGGESKPHGIMKWETPNELDENGEPIPYTWTVPAGVSEIWVSAAAGGAGGAGGGLKTSGATATNVSMVCCGSGGGAGDSVLKEQFIVTPGNTIEIIVGKGGIGGAKGSLTAMGSIGENGTKTIIGDLISLLPGKAAPVSIATGLRGGPNASSGKVARTFSGNTTGVNTVDLGNGGNNLIGFGGNGLAENGVYGGGGCGGRASDLNPDGDQWFDGGKGGDGVVIIEW